MRTLGPVTRGLELGTHTTNQTSPQVPETPDLMGRGGKRIFRAFWLPDFPVWEP